MTLRRSFDAIVTRLSGSPTTLSERELLQPTHWALGEDARLREDERFRETLWGRWMLAEDILANDAIHGWLHAERRSVMPLAAALARTSAVFGRHCVLCPSDPRLVLRCDEVHLAASELSADPVVEHDIGELEKFTTHLPLHSLRAVAASEPAGQWGARAREQAIEPLGWVRVALPGRRLHDRMFIAAIEGHSMDDGKSGLVDGGYAVFELWPTGTRQHANVLVRGAFHDPETGSYAVKKYVADQRDAEGRHHAISLVSLHPNKARYPDIEIRPEDDDAITVVAKVVHALSTDDYERRPKPRRRVGYRNLVGREGLDEQQRRLGQRLASFFDSKALEADGDDDDDEPETTPLGWQARIVCFDVAAGGVQLELGPLDGLPPFVKKLRVEGGSGWEATLVAANARTRPMRVSTRPSSGPWRWEAVGFEREQDLDLDRLALPAIATDVPTVFRVDADDVGQRLDTTTLAPGQAYRVLLPPAVGDPSLGVELDAGPGGAWRLWSLELGAPLSPETRRSLASLGLELGDAHPRLEWALAGPAVWRTNARGQSYPVFESGVEIVLHASGLTVDEGEAAMLFLHGTTGTQSLPLSTSGLVSLGTLVPGRWACGLLHARTSVAPATLVFEVANHATEHIPAAWSATAESGVTSLEVIAPPGWPISSYWRVLDDMPLGTVHAGEDGMVDLDGIRGRIEDRARRARMADLVIDLRELGRRSFPHDGRMPVERVCASLTDLWQQRSALVQRHVGAWLQLMPMWFEPVTALLGYGLEPLPREALPTMETDLHGLAAWRLTVDERMMGSIMRSPSRVLVLTTNLDATLRDCRAWIDQACSAAQVRAAIITDGTRWTTHRKGDRRLKQREWNLHHAIGLGHVDELLNDLAEGL